MFTKFGILFVLTIIAVQKCEQITGQPNSNDLQQGFTTRCDELCSKEIQEVKKKKIFFGVLFRLAVKWLDQSISFIPSFPVQDLRPDCQRGCQYYNIEFLVSASNKNKVTDLETTNHECRLCECKIFFSVHVLRPKKASYLIHSATHVRARLFI